MKSRHLLSLSAKFPYPGPEEPTQSLNIGEAASAPSKSPIKSEGDREVLDLRLENEQLSRKIEFLRAELRKNVPSLKLYRLGAGTVSLSGISLLTWASAGISIPFHPMFAIASLPVGVVFMLMAWMTLKNDRSSEPTA
jgi:hypothetical protein